LSRLPIKQGSQSPRSKAGVSQQFRAPLLQRRESGGSIASALAGKLPTPQSSPRGIANKSTQSSPRGIANKSTQSSPRGIANKSTQSSPRGVANKSTQPSAGNLTPRNSVPPSPRGGAGLNRSRELPAPGGFLRQSGSILASPRIPSPQGSVQASPRPHHPTPSGFGGGHPLVRTTSSFIQRPEGTSSKHSPQHSPQQSPHPSASTPFTLQRGADIERKNQWSMSQRSISLPHIPPQQPQHQLPASPVSRRHRKQNKP
jgi:hypothetical protein